MGLISIPNDLPSNFEDEFREVTRRLDQSREVPRIAQIALARRNYLYWQGKQYLMPVFDGGGDRVIDWKPAGKSADRSQFRSVYNIVYSDGIKFISVAIQRKPNVKAVPNDPDDEEHVTAAKDADGVARYLHRLWGMPAVTFKTSFHQWVTGPVFGYTRHVVNKRRYGTISVPQVEIEQQELLPPGFQCLECGEPSPSQRCPNCGGQAEWTDGLTLDVPKTTMLEKARGAVELSIYSVLHVEIPFEATKKEEVYDLTFSESLTKWQAKALVEDVPDEWLRADTQQTTVTEAAQALQDIQSPGKQRGERKDEVVHQRRWMRPEEYGDFSPENRRYLKQNYENGVLVARFGDKIIEMAHECLDDHWSICPTQTGELLTSGPLCEVGITVQDDTNQFWNMAKEVVLRSIPKTLADSTLFKKIDANALINEIIPVVANGEDMSKKVHNMQLSRFSDQLIPFGELLRNFAREAWGITPAIYGGGEPAPTWRAEAQRKNQALMQLLNPFAAQQNFYSECTENGIHETATVGYGMVRVPGSKTLGGLDMDAPQEINFETLSVDGWHVEPSEDSPMTFTEKAQRVDELIKENPGQAQAMGLGHPMNAAPMQKFYGLDDLYVIGSQEREKWDARIRQLLSEFPMKSMDPMTGMETEMSSIPPDEFADKNHAAVAEYFRAFINSRKADMLAEKNPEGLRNVWLHGKEQDEAAMAAMMPPPGMEQPGPPGKPGKPQQDEAAAGPQAVPMTLPKETPNARIG